MSIFSIAPSTKTKIGYRCEWCGMTTHGGCRAYISNECTFGVLQPIYLPPHAVSIPRTEVPMEAIIGVQIKSKSTPLQRDYSCRKYLISIYISLQMDFNFFCERKISPSRGWIDELKKMYKNTICSGIENDRFLWCRWQRTIDTASGLDAER